MSKEAIKVPDGCVTQAVKLGKATVYVSLVKSEIPELKKHAGSTSSYSPTAFKLTDCPTPQEPDEKTGKVEVLEVTVPLVLRTMNNKAIKGRAVIEDNEV